MTDWDFIDKAKCLRERTLTIVRAYIGNSTEAEDIAQDAMLKLWTKRKTLDGGKIEMMATVIAKHLSIDHLRSVGARPQHSISIDEFAAMQIAGEQDSATDIEQRSQLLLKAVKHLPSQQQILLRLRYFNGKDIDSIAQITGSSTDSIYKSLSRARMTLYRLLTMAMILICIVCLPFMLTTKEKPRVAQVTETTTTTTSSDDSKRSLLVSEPPAKASTASQATNSSHSKSPRKKVQIVQNQRMVIYSDAENDDIKIVATMSYTQTDSGNYKVLSCEYEPVIDSGRKAFFVPDEDTKCNINASMVNIDINGTLTYEDANGQPVEKYVSVNQVVFK